MEKTETEKKLINNKRKRPNEKTGKNKTGN